MNIFEKMKMIDSFFDDLNEEEFEKVLVRNGSESVNSAGSEGYYMSLSNKCIYNASLRNEFEANLEFDINDEMSGAA